MLLLARRRNGSACRRGGWRCRGWSRLSSRRRRRRWRRDGSGATGRHDRGAPLVADHRERERRQHEDDGDRGGELAEHGGRAHGSEDGLTPAAAERRANVGALACLQQNEPDDDEAHDDVKRNDEREEHCGLLLWGAALGGRFLGDRDETLSL